MPPCVTLQRHMCEVHDSSASSFLRSVSYCRQTSITRIKAWSVQVLARSKKPCGLFLPLDSQRSERKPTSHRTCGRTRRFPRRVVIQKPARGFLGVFDSPRAVIENPTLLYSVSRQTRRTKGKTLGATGHQEKDSASGNIFDQELGGLPEIGPQKSRQMIAVLPITLHSVFRSNRHQNHSPGIGNGARR